MTTTPRGATLLQAVRLNFAHLIELDKFAPADVNAIAGAMVSHLRAWKPFVLNGALAMAESIEPLPVDPDPTASSARLDLGDGAHYLLEYVAETGHIIISLDDAAGDHAIRVVTVDQAEQLRADLARVIAAAKGAV